MDYPPIPAKEGEGESADAGGGGDGGAGASTEHAADAAGAAPVDAESLSQDPKTTPARRRCHTGTGSTTGTEGRTGSGVGSDSLSQEAEARPAGSRSHMGSPVDAKLLPGGGGVYLLTDEDDRLVQLGSAGDLRRALRNRLIDPPPEEQDGLSVVARRRARLGEVVRKIRWRVAHSMFEIDYQYRRIARELMPDEYLENVAFGPVWFVHVDPAAEIPRFVSSKRLRGRPGLDLGPFATHADANRFVQILEDGFDLCRYHQVLEQVPNGQPCAYYEMGRCPAPCNGSIPMSAYREVIAKALAFGCGERAEVYETWQGQMEAAAGEQAFEEAGQIKQRLERVRGIEHAAFRLVRPVDGFDYLVIQRGKGRSWLKPFFVRGGWIAPGEPAKLKAVEQAVPGWMAEMKRQYGPGDAGSEVTSNRLRQRGEQIWLVSHYLFKAQPPGLFIHESELADAAVVAERVRERFTPATSDNSTESAEAPEPGLGQ